MHLDVATGGELHVALAAGVPAERLRAARQQQVASTSCARRATPGVGRIVVDSFDELDRLDALARRRRARPAGAAPGHAGRRGPHPRVHRAPARTTRSSASAWPPATPRDAVEPRSGRRRRSTSSGSTATSAARCSSPTSSTRRSRCWPRSCRDVGLPELVARRRARRRLRRGRGGADDHRVGARRASTACRRRRHHGPRHRRARPGDRRAGGGHPLHGRHDQGHPRRAHLRGRRRRHERQPAAGALRQRATRRSCPRATDARAAAAR